MGAMAFGFFVLAPIGVVGFWWPLAWALVIALAVGMIVLLVHVMRKDKGIAVTRIGVRGERFAEITRAYGLACPRCGYDLSGADKDRCPECGEELEVVVRTQVYAEFIQQNHGKGISDRDMRGLTADATKWLGVLLLFPAFFVPAGIVVQKAVIREQPAIIAGACAVFVGWTAWRWWRRRFEDDLPRQRSEAVIGLLVLAVVAIVVSLGDLL